VAAVLVAVLASLAVASTASAQPLGVQQQVSFSGDPDEVFIDSTNSAIAYGEGRSLVVWEERDVSGRGFSPNRIMGRFVDGTGAPLDNQFQISDEDENELKVFPDVAYDSARKQFFVVWQSTLTTDVEERGFPTGTIRGATVTPSGAVSDSKDLTPGFDDFADPATAYNAVTDEFLVAFSDNDSNVLVRKVKAGDLSFEGDPVQVSPQTFQKRYADAQPDVASDASGRWLVVWHATSGFKLEAPKGVPDFTIEVYGRSIGSDLDGPDVQRISHIIGDGFDSDFGAREPAVAADEKGGGYLVAYSGFPKPPDETDNTGRTFGRPTEEIFARRVNAGDATPAGDAIQVSDTGDDEEDHDARRPDVWHDSNADQFLVSWSQAVDELDQSREDRRIEYEIFGKKVDGTGAPIETAQQQISNHNPNAENLQFDGDLAAVTYDKATCDYVVAWTGEDFANENLDEKEVIFDRAYDAPACAVPERIAAAVTAAGAPSRRCGSRRSFPIHLVRRSDREYIFAVVKVNGQEVKVVYGDRVEAVVNLVGLPLGRFAVDISARLEDGREIKGIRRYFTCSKKLPPSNGLERKDAI
jgi:hypothetical protein